MQFLPKLMTLLAMLLSIGSGATMSLEGTAEASASGPMILLVTPHAYLLQSPLQPPRSPDPLVVSIGESEIDEDDSDKVEKSFATTPFLIELFMERSTVSLNRSAATNRLVHSSTFFSILRC